MKKPVRSGAFLTLTIVFATVIVVAGVIAPYPSEGEALVSRWMVALVAGLFVALLPAAFPHSIPWPLRALAVLVAFVAVFHINPTALLTRGVTIEPRSLVINEIPAREDQVEYDWKPAGLRFRFPEQGWIIKTKSERGGFSSITFRHRQSVDTFIRLHTRPLGTVYQGGWEQFRQNTMRIWSGADTGEDYFSFGSLPVAQREGLRVSGRLPGRGEGEGPRVLELVYAPIGKDRIAQLELVRRADDPNRSAIDETFSTVAETLRLSE
jgi:hypothetical protein